MVCCEEVVMIFETVAWAFSLFVWVRDGKKIAEMIKVSETADVDLGWNYWRLCMVVHGCI